MGWKKKGTGMENRIRKEMIMGWGLGGVDHDDCLEIAHPTHAPRKKTYHKAWTLTQTSKAV